MAKLTKPLDQFRNHHPAVSRWFNNNAEGSESTARAYLEWLQRYLKARLLTVDELLQEGRERNDEAMDALQDYLQVKVKHLAPKTRNLIKNAVKSFYDYNKVHLIRKIKIRNVVGTPPPVSYLPRNRFLVLLSIRFRSRIMASLIRLQPFLG